MEFCNALGTRRLRNSRELHPGILARNEMLTSEADLLRSPQQLPISAEAFATILPRPKGWPKRQHWAEQVFPTTSVAFQVSASLAAELVTHG
jgi:hypothetical protein